MRRGTTPTLVIKVNEDATAWPTVHIAFKQSKHDVIVKTLTDLEDDPELDEDGHTVFRVPLSQNDTLAFRSGSAVEVQIRALDSDGNAVATTIGSIDVKRILEEGVLDGDA